MTATKSKPRPKSEPQSTSIQLWPRGRMLYYTGDPWGPKLRVKDYNRDAPQTWRKPTPEDVRDIRINILAQRYSDQEIYCCDSCLVSELDVAASELPKDLASAFDLSDSENVKNLYPDEDSMDLEECREHLADHGHDEPDYMNPWKMDRAALVEIMHGEDPNAPEEGESAICGGMTDEQLLEGVIQLIDEETIDGLDKWRDAVRDNAEAADVYEWWRISGWLGSHLEKVGEVVLDNGYGTWWGRTCTDQGYMMDGTLQKVAALHVD